MNDLGKVAVLAAIMGAILLVGLLMAPTDRTPDVEEPVAIVSEAPPEVIVVQEETLELLDPVYSEKAVYQDGTIRIAFDASYVEAGLESRLPFWLHNVSGDVINVLWERCSLQLPNGNTVSVLSEESLIHFGTPGSTISIAPSGDLFDAVIPVSELGWDEDGAWSVTTGVLDAGTFTLVLAIERGETRPRAQIGHRVLWGLDNEDCEPDRIVGHVVASDCDGRSIVYYTFRFVVR